MPIDEQYIALMQLPCGQQPGECADDIPLDGALQVAGSIPLVGALRQEELSAFARDSKQKGACCRVQHALLYLPEFDVKHFVKLRALQRMKHDHLVQTVHELRRELPSGCLLSSRSGRSLSATNPLAGYRPASALLYRACRAVAATTRRSLSQFHQTTENSV